MQYMLLVYENSEKWAALSKDEKNQIHADCGAWHEQIVKAGQARIAGALEPGSTATTVRMTADRPMLTDGPFAETREVLGGFEIVECRDLNEALALAKTFPALRVGFAMEVRPLRFGGCHEA